MSNVAAAEIESTTEFVESYPQRISYNGRQVSLDPLVLSETEIQRYDRPRADTVIPREYAFHLLGNVIGRTIIDLGCGDGVNSVILASLGARVFSIDISKHSLDVTAQRAASNRVDNRVTLLHSDATAIPLEASSVDAVLCTALLHQVDPIQTARQIRRVVQVFDLHVVCAELEETSDIPAVENFVGPAQGLDVAFGHASASIPAPGTSSGSRPRGPERGSTACDASRASAPRGTLR